MNEQILTQDEVDALLQGISGESESPAQWHHDKERWQRSRTGAGEIDERLVRVGTIAIEERCDWLTADFNCTAGSR